MEEIKVHPLLMDVEPHYSKWAGKIDKEVNFTLENSFIHSKFHEKRVLVHSIILGREFGLNDRDLNALGAAATFHDTRRWDDGLDLGHGRRGAEHYRAKCIEKNLEFDIRAFLSIYYHDLNDEIGYRAFREQGLSNKDILIYKIFKDADALDRVRIEGALDPSYLRMNFSHRMIDFAYWLVELIK